MPRAQPRELLSSGLSKKKYIPLNHEKTRGKTHFWPEQKKSTFTRFPCFARKPWENDTFPLPAGRRSH